MKIAVVGAGAMGSIYAGLMASVGTDVLLINSPGAHIEAIQKEGLRISGGSGDRVVHLRAEDHCPAEPADLIILAVKATQVENAAISARAMLGGQTSVLTIQNGLGSADIVAEIMGADRLAVGIAAAFGASIVAPGHVHHKAMEAIRLGRFAGMAPMDMAAIAAIWRNAGFAVDVVDNIIAMQWEKLICNASFSAPCALTGLTVGEAMASREMAPLCLAAGVEAWEIAVATGVNISVTDADQHVRAFAARVAGAKPSLLQDIQAGRPSEIDYINGAVATAAARVGKAAPINMTLTRLVRQLEQSALSTASGN